MQCFFSSIPYDDLTVGDLRSGRYYRTQTGYLGHDDRIWGSQAAAAENPFAQLWMVYARADKRWAGADTVRFFERTHTYTLGVNGAELVASFSEGTRNKTLTLSRVAARAS